MGRTFGGWLLNRFRQIQRRSRRSWGRRSRQVNHEVIVRWFFEEDCIRRACDPSATRFSFVVHLVQIAESDHPEDLDTFFRFTLESRTGPRRRIFGPLRGEQRWIYLGFKADVGSHPTEDAGSLHRWQGINQNTPSSKDMFVQGERRWTQDAQQVWEVESWVRWGILDVGLEE